MSTPYDIPDLITYETVEIRGSLAVVTFSVPYDLLKSFQLLLNKFLLLVSFVSLKARHSNCIQGPSAEVIAFNDAAIKRRDKHVLTLFDKFISSGASFRDSVRSVRDDMNKNGNVITCYMIELIMRDSGRLSKRKGRVSNG